MSNFEFRLDDRGECPKCGEEHSFETIPLRNWQDNELGVVMGCWSCDLNVEGVISPIPERFNVNCIACNKECRPIGLEYSRLCEDCQDKLVLFDTEFGIVIPKETGVVYQNQTHGMLCGRSEVEGVKFSLREPHRDGENLVNAIASANYDGRHDDVKDLWRELKERLWFDFEEIDAPENQQNNAEAFQWIRITDIEGENYIPVKENYETLVGKEVVLHYQNCD